MHLTEKKKKKNSQKYAHMEVFDVLCIALMFTGSFCFDFHCDILYMKAEKKLILLVGIMHKSTTRDPNLSRLHHLGLQDQFHLVVTGCVVSCTRWCHTGEQEGAWGKISSDNSRYQHLYILVYLPYHVVTTMTEKLHCTIVWDSHTYTNM